MGEGLDQIYAYCSDDELGESSSLSGGSDDESDSNSNSHHHNNNKDSSSVHGLSSLVSQLPIKKGLSKFYQGKSQSLSSFTNITSVEDLAKKETADPMRRKMMKPSRSYAAGLDDDDEAHGHPTTTTTKKKNGPLMRVSSSYCGSSIPRTASGCSFFATTELPPIPMNNNM